MSSTSMGIERLPTPAVYGQREDRNTSWPDRLGQSVEGWWRRRFSGIERHRYIRFAAEVNAFETEMVGLASEDIPAFARVLAVDLRRSGLGDTQAARVFALVREVAGRTVGMRHFDTQVIGGFIMLRGALAEMETGEGKTLTATLPACTVALTGLPVHIITVNDYLAERDRELLCPVYEALGLSVGTALENADINDRRAAYRCDVVYCTNKVVAFDYLRDRILLGNHSGNLRLKLERLHVGGGRVGKLLLRGLGFAIVDEADSALIDEARTPLIISQRASGDQDERQARQALEIASALEEGVAYRKFSDEQRLELTPEGRSIVAARAAAFGGLWRSPVFREDMAVKAIASQRFYRRDEHYLVKDGKVQIVDEYTGRVMPDRHWGEGLQQIIEVKEGCEVTPRVDPIARITYQRFFRRYQRLAGMTGTASEVAGELWSVYRLMVIKVPTNRQVRRQQHPSRVFATSKEKWRAIIAAAHEVHAAGRPVLIGTRSVSASELVSAHLTEAGLEHQVLNAAQDRDEAEVIARAGESGRITVATNMAGRGTDILLENAVAQRGGLHVIVSERHDSARIDRQLVGRCGRQGDPGSFAMMNSLEDSLLDGLLTGWAGAALLRLVRLSPGRASLLFGWAQRSAQRRHAQERSRLLSHDQKLGDVLAFSGEME